MIKKGFSLITVICLLSCMLFGCADSGKETEKEPAGEPVAITVAGSWPDCRAIDVVANSFTKENPECTVVYEYVQDYYSSLETRFNGDSPVDLFISTNIQPESEMLPYAEDLYSCEGLDLSQTYDGLLKNFEFREESSESQKLYAIPLGAEMRGLYVNTTLLDSLSIEVPTDQESLFNACKVLKDNGFIPFHGNPGVFGQTLIYPWVCNTIANADDYTAAYNRVNTREAGVSTMFNEPFEFLYKLVENGYYDYKKAQTELNLFNETTDEAYAYYFLNIADQDGELIKKDDIGQVAFMPSPMSLNNVISRVKEDYHSNMEYTFIPAPIDKDGGFVYASPAHGIAISNKSANKEWAVKFLNFLFQPENNTVFAKEFNVIPNTKEALAYIKEQFDVPEDRVSQLGQVTFDYGFYNLILPSMVDVSKANNPKYMKDDGSGNLTMYPFRYYMDELEAAFHS